MPQLSPMKWLLIYFIMLIIMILLMINMNFFNKFFTKKKIHNNNKIYNMKWKF